MQKINTALLSFGMSGWVFHAPFIALDPHFELYAVWERSKKLAHEKYPGIKSYSTLNEVLSDPVVELVVVNTPNYSHYEYAKLALLADKHIVVEKPFTVTVEEGEELIALAKARNRMISVYQNRRYDSDYKTIKKVLDESLLGEIVEAEFQFMRYSEQIGPKLHKEQPGPGTGSLYDLGSHLIDQALQLFGMPHAIFADIRIFRPVSMVDDYFELLLYYDNLRVRLRSSYLVREAPPGYILHGRKGSFLKSKTNVQEEALAAGKMPDDPHWGTEPESENGLLHSEINGRVVREFITSQRGNYAEYYDGIYKALRNGAAPPVTAEDGLKVIRIIQKAYESNEKKCIVDV